MSSASPPRGHVSLVFTSVPSAALLWEAEPRLMHIAAELHDALVLEALSESPGLLVKRERDAYMLAFSSARDAVRWCVELQLLLHTAPWPDGLLELAPAAEMDGFRGLRVAMGIHAGYPELRTGSHGVDYFGPDVNRAARVAGAARGGQVLASADTLLGLLVEGWTPLDHGAFALKGIDASIRLMEIRPIGLGERRLGRPQAPRQDHWGTDVLLGRDDEVHLAQTLLESGERLLTITGAVGVGKSALVRAIAAAWPPGVVSMSLEGVTDEAAIRGRLSQVLAGGVRALDRIPPRLLVLDGVDDGLSALIPSLDGWLRRHPGLQVLIASQERTRIAGETCLELPPLPTEIALQLVAQAHGMEIERAQQLVDTVGGIPMALLDGERSTLQLQSAWRRLSDQERGLVRTAATQESFGLDDLAEAAERDLLDLLPVIERLRDKSWVREEIDFHTGEPRFALYTHQRRFARAAS